MSAIKKTDNRLPSFDVDNESHNLAMNSNEDNSFNAVDLSGLKPDPVPEYAKLQITKYANIIDKSDEIEFADGWDDN